VELLEASGCEVDRNQGGELMNRLLVLALLVIAALTSCAATPLVVPFTVPTQSNVAACGAAPFLSPLNPPNGLEVLLRWTGPRTDSLRLSGLAPGLQMAKSIYADAPVGDYHFTAWVEQVSLEGARYQSCPASVVITVSAKPDTLRCGL
jgi:hypothetical protein